MRTEIRRLHQSLGLTTVYVTHDQEEALSLADRLVVLREGRVQQVGTPDELYDHPRNWHVADFMGYRNILPGTVVAATGGEGLRVGVGAGVGATTLTGRPVGDRPGAGDTVRVAVRPDDLAVVADGEPPRDGNALRGTVAVVEYHGREFAVVVQADDGTLLHVRTPVAPRVGEELTLTAPAERVLVFPAALAGEATAGAEARAVAA